MPLSMTGEGEWDVSCIVVAPQGMGVYLNV